MSKGSPRAWRCASSTGCSALLLFLLAAGCGGAEGEPPPALPPDVGTALASATGEVTAALEAGDPVLAQAEATELLAAVEAALATGEVPRPLAREVRRGAQRLAALVEAAQPPPPAPAPEPPSVEDDDDDDEDDDEEEDGPGKGKGKGKDKDKDKGKDKDDD